MPPSAIAVPWDDEQARPQPEAGRRALSPLTLDVRALAVFRLGLGLVLLATFGWLAAEFVDAPPRPPQQLPWAAAYAATLGLLAVAATALTLGWSSRAMALVSMLALLAVDALEPSSAPSASICLRLLLLWAALLPIGERYSIDAAARARPALGDRVSTLASAGFLLQLLLIHLVPSVIGDTQSVVRSVTPLGRRLENLPFLPASLVDGAEAAVFLLLVAAFALTGRARAAAAAALVLLHLTLGVGMELGSLPLVLGLAWAAMLPPTFFDAVRGRVWTPERLGLTLWHSDREATQIARVRLLQTFLLLPGSAARPTSEDIDMDVYRRQRDSWVVTDHHGYRFVRFRALIEAMRWSPILWPLAPLLRIGLLETIGDWVYDLTKRKGGPLMWLVGRGGDPSTRRWHEGLAGVLLVALPVWQLLLARADVGPALAPLWRVLRVVFGG